MQSRISINEFQAGSLNYFQASEIVYTGCFLAYTAELLAVVFYCSQLAGSYSLCTKQVIKMEVLGCVVLSGNLGNVNCNLKHYPRLFVGRHFFILLHFTRNFFKNICLPNFIVHTLGNGNFCEQRGR